MTAIGSATSGMMSAVQQLNAVASGVAAGTADPVTSTVNEISAVQTFKANTAVLSTADRMMGSLLDLKV